MYTTLVSPGKLAGQLDNPHWMVIDSRFSLDDIERGRRDYRQGHIHGALYAHLEEDLSGTVVPGKTGRHPLPEIEALQQTFSRWGIDENIQVVAYDDDSGKVAARLWWMLRWLGHEQVAVLDGGWRAWREGHYPVTREEPLRAARRFIARPRPELLAGSDFVLAIMNDPRYRLIDARAAERYRGEQEPIDPVAGHIPGAISRPLTENWDREGRMLPAERLQASLRKLLGEVDSQRVISYCGSGVTACHNLLALSHAGMGDGKLYVGSWSEWITDPNRPIVSPRKIK